MSKVYTTQTDLKLVVQTGRNLSTASSVKLRYENPTSTKGELDVTITDAINGVVEYTTPSDGAFSIAGTWSFWIYIIDNSLISVGEPFTVQFNNEGT